MMIAFGLQDKTSSETSATFQVDGMVIRSGIL